MTITAISIKRSRCLIFPKENFNKNKIKVTEEGSFFHWLLNPNGTGCASLNHRFTSSKNSSFRPSSFRPPRRCLPRMPLARRCCRCCISFQEAVFQGPAVDSWWLSHFVSSSLGVIISKTWFHQLELHFPKSVRKSPHAVACKNKCRLRKNRFLQRYGPIHSSCKQKRLGLGKCEFAGWSDQHGKLSFKVASIEP